MSRRLSAEEQALWGRVVSTVRPLRMQDARALEPPSASAPAPPAPRPRPAPTPHATTLRKAPAGVGTSLDGGWDKRLARGAVVPDVVVDLHGHNLTTAYALLDRRIEDAIRAGARVILLITGRPPSDDRRPVARGAIRAAVGDWLAASRHAADIAAVRPAHPRHGGAGALYLILRRKRG